MKLYNYKDYDEYVKAQINKYELKRNNVWVNNKELNQIATIIDKRMKKMGINLKEGICHGVRTGYEVEYLQNKFIDAKIYGSEIAESRNDRIYKMDFHEIPDDWYERFDFVYSNSFDHSYDPEKCLDAWMDSLHSLGVCIIHWMATNARTINDSDCFAGTLADYRKLITMNYDILSEKKMYNGARVLISIVKRK